VTDATTGELRFTEVEHKFVVDDQFDVDAFGAALDALHPSRTTSLRVLDTYYLLAGSRARRYVVRHRYDPELHHLTVKTLQADSEVRQEVNIDLGHHAGDQRAQIDAFLEQLGIEWSGSLQKELMVWYFPDVEVVHYRASTGSREIRCVEFEAIHKPTLREALQVLRRYEAATGFDEIQRSHQSLPQMLFPEVGKRLTNPRSGSRS